MMLRRALRSLAVRLTLTYMALFCGSIGLMLGITYLVGVWRPLQIVEANIRRDSDALVAIYKSQGRNALIRALDRRAAAAQGRLPYHVLIAPNGAVVAANLNDYPLKPGPEWVRYEFGTYATGNEEEHETVARDLRLEGGYRLLIGLDTEDLDEREDTIVEATTWGAGMALVLGFLGGLVMTSAMSTRLESINLAARAVIGGDLSGRVQLMGSGDDFDQLSATLNEMLARIEALVASISRVSDNIAHELRTPLARLQAELEDLAAAQDPVEAQSRVNAALGEAARLREMFESLLRLARLENGGAEDLEPVNLSLIVDDAVELYRPAAEEKSQTLDAVLAQDVAVKGARDLLFQTLSNLLDNAIKYTPAGGRVSVSLERANDMLRLVVADNGPGIAAEDHKRVLERFYRGPDVDRASGYGLGLSLVAAAVSRQGAILRLEDAKPGLRVVIEFPPSAAV